MHFAPEIWEDFVKKSTLSLLQFLCDLFVHYAFTLSLDKYSRSSGECLFAFSRAFFGSRFPSAS